MKGSNKNAFNSRSYQGQLERELVVGGLIIGLVVGIGLIYLLWGHSAALTSLFCFVLFLGVIGLVWGLLALMGWLAGQG